MNNEEKILEILNQMQADISGLKGDVSGLKADVAEIKTVQAEQTEILEEHTQALNALISWADECRNAYKFPLPKLM